MPLITGFKVQPRITTGKTPEGVAVNARLHIAAFLESIRPDVVASVKDKMRYGATGDERRSVKGFVTQTPGRVKAARPTVLHVESDAVEAAVDEGGRVPGWAPWKDGTDLFEWVLFRLGQTVGARTGPVKSSRSGPRPLSVATQSFFIARAQMQRGLPRPGDELRQPFKTTHKEYDRIVRAGLKQARDQAVKEAIDAAR